MLETIEINLGDRRYGARQQFYWDNAAGFLQWCEWNLRACTEKLEQSSKDEFSSGKIPQPLLDLARTDLSERLRAGLSWSERFETVQRTLTDPKDLAAWMNCPIGKLDKLPKHIRDAVAEAERVRC